MKSELKNLFQEKNFGKIMKKKSISIHKMPSDWMQRKELAYQRDNKSCNRCGDTF